MIDYTYTVANGNTGRAKVFDRTGAGFHYEAIETVDFAASCDSIADILRESLESGDALDYHDLAVRILGESRREILAELLMKLFVVLKDSNNLALDIDILIAASGIGLEDVPDSAIASRHGLMRQTLSARKKSILKRLDMKPPAHSKSKLACDTYKLTNRKKTSNN